MILRLLVSVVLGTAQTVLAQSSRADAGRAADFDAEMGRIQAEQQLQEAQYEQEEQQCYQQFSVTSCLNEVRKRRRASLEQLHKQEMVLKQGERQRKAQLQVERVAQKAAQAHSEQEALRLSDAMQANKAREERSRQKAGTSSKPGVVATHASANVRPQGRSGAEISEAKRRYQEKLNQARAQRAAWEKRQKEETGKRAAPLPLAP